MTIETRLKNMIIDEYGSLSSFVEHTDLKYSTVDSILKRGVMNSNIHNVIKICQALQISTDELAKGNIVPVAEHDKESFDITQFIQIFRYKLSDPETAVLDGQHLTAGEAEFFMDSLDLIIEQLRKKRK